MKNINKKQIKENLPMGIFYLAMLALTVVLIFSFGGMKPKSAKKIGFITTGDVNTTGWSAINYKGIKEACDEMGVELEVYAEVKEGDGSCPKAVEELVNSGCGMIILNSSVYSEEMSDLLANYPDTVFYGANSEIKAPNLTPYSSRLYQVRYLSGIIAGMYTEANKIGYVASVKDSAVYRGLNAFALGVRRVNPDAVVYVKWTDHWDDIEVETNAAETLINETGVDVITYHQHEPYVIRTAEEHGVASIGYYEPLENVSEKYLACAMCDWRPIYEEFIRQFLREQGNTVDADWKGLDTGALMLTRLSPLVTQEIREEIAKASDEIKAGLDVFTGEIRDNEGNTRCFEGEAMSDSSLLYEMDWLVDGVTEL